MAKERDYYEILGVGKNADQDELKNAFRNLARKYHPDINKDPKAEEQFKEINEAYQVLSDPDKRAAYDRFGKAGVSGMGGFDYSQVDLSDILGDLFGFGGFSGFGGFGGSQYRSQTAPRRGADLQSVVTLEFEEATFGVDKEISFVRDEKCTKCQGTGAEPGTTAEKCAHCNGRGEVKTTRQTMFGSMVQVSPCPVCNGKGEIIRTPCTQCHGNGLERKTVKRIVAIPAGVDTGTRIRLSGEGQPGINNGPNGDLYVDVRVKPHKIFQRKDTDIYLDLNINIAQATLGDMIDIPTIDGTEPLKIPAGTQPGRIITLKGKGIPYLRGNGRGDQKVIVNVVIPSSVTPEQRVLLEQLGELLGTEVTPQEKNIWERLKEALNG
jgi:molecular chaperone DnaJ